MAAANEEMKTECVDLGLENSLIEKVIRCKDAYFRSQQIGEPDLTLDEKRVIVRDILSQKGPAYFLSRFHQFLDDSDLGYFEPLKDDYEVAFYTKNIREKPSKRECDTKVKNRRYAALQTLVKGGKYFCEHQMRKRDPEMFEHFVGQYMSKKEKEEMDLKAEREEDDLRLSNILIDRLEEEDRFIEEYDSDSEESGDEAGENGSGKVVLSDCERKLLKDEFLTNMHRRFLEGRDSDFDYSSVDNNADYDSLEVVQQDAEDSYFDTEEPTTGAEQTEMELDLETNS